MYVDNKLHHKKLMSWFCGLLLHNDVVFTRVELDMKHLIGFIASDAEMMTLWMIFTQ